LLYFYESKNAIVDASILFWFTVFLLYFYESKNAIVDASSFVFKFIHIK